MDDLIVSHLSGTSDRTPQIIAVEINMIKYQAGKVALYSIIEIGRRLREVKEKIPHGEWGQWLRDSVNYSQKTAGKFMKIYDAYGKKIPDSGTSPQELPNLTYSQALILLGVPEEERPDFIAELNIEGMSTRELQKEVDERKEALAERDQAREEKALAKKEKEQTQEKLEQLIIDKENLQKQLDGKNSEIDQLTAQNRTLTDQAADYKQKYESTQKDAPEKEEKPAQDTDDALSAERIAAMKNQIKNAEAQYISYRDQLLRAFENMTQALLTLNRKDPEIKEKHRQAAYEMMTNLTKQLEVYPPIPTFIVI